MRLTIIGMWLLALVLSVMLLVTTGLWIIALLFEGRFDFLSFGGIFVFYILTVITAKWANAVAGEHMKSGNRDD